MILGSFQDSFSDVLMDRNRNLMESSEIIKNFLALKDMEKGGLNEIP
jgi:hypothetical protein